MTTLKKIGLATALILTSASTFAQGPIVFTCTESPRIHALVGNTELDVMPVFGTSQENRTENCTKLANDLNDRFNTSMLKYNNDLNLVIENMRFETIYDGSIHTMEKNNSSESIYSETRREASTLFEIEAKHRIEISNFYTKRLNQLLFKLKNMQ